MDGNSFHKAIHLVRWHEWGDSKLPFIFIAWFIAAHKYSMTAMLPILFGVIGFSSCFLAFGYLYNDWMDRVSDKRSGKNKIVHQMQSRWVGLILGGLVLLSLACLAPWLNHLLILIQIMLSYLLAITYSGTCFRFKERGMLGLIVSSLAQRTLPASLIFGIFGVFDYSAMLFLILTFVIGLRWMIIHQIEDFERDTITQVRTHTIRHGVNIASKQLIWLLNFELFLLIFLAISLESTLIWFIYFLYLLLTVIMSIVSASTPWQMLRHPSTAYLALADFYFLYLPLGLAIGYSLDYPPVLVVVVLLGFLLFRHILSHWTDLKWLSGQIWGSII
jgi:4-hydroxybenzoate polyprenyltransferase